jgi:hypothetical protein
MTIAEEGSRNRCIGHMSRQITKLKSVFRFESEMAAPVVRWLRRRGLIVKSEFLLPWGVCDLVAVKLDTHKTKQRLSYGQTRAIGSLLRLLVLSKIPDHDTGRSITVTRLGKDLGGFLPQGVVQKEIDALTRAGFVTSPKRGLLQKLNGWAPLHAELVAIELKLARVSEAVSQAASNRQFATHSYVALPMHMALRLAQSKRADLLAGRGIGLLGVSAARCRELIKPSPGVTVQNPLIQMHVVERFWRTRGNLPSTVSR